MSLLSVFLKLCRIPRLLLAVVRARWYGSAVLRASGATHGTNLPLCVLPNIACLDASVVTSRHRNR